MCFSHVCIVIEKNCGNHIFNLQQHIHLQNSEINDENMTPSDIQPVNNKQCSNDNSIENIELQVITTEPGVQKPTYKPKEKDTSQDTVGNGITEEDDTEMHKAILGAPKAGVAMRRATVGVPTFSKDDKTSETPNPMKPQRGGFRRTDEPRHAVLRGLTQVYHKQ